MVDNSPRATLPPPFLATAASMEVALKIGKAVPAAAKPASTNAVFNLSSSLTLGFCPISANLEVPDRKPTTAAAPVPSTPAGAAPNSSPPTPPTPVAIGLTAADFL